MSIIFTQTDTAAQDGLLTACGNLGTQVTTPISCQMSEGAAAGTTEATLTVHSNDAANAIAIALQSAPGEPNDTSWEAGDYVVRINVTAGNTDLAFTEVHVCRISSGGTIQETIGSLTGLAEDLSAGVHTFTVSGAAATALSSDELYISIAVNQAAGHGNMSAGITFDQNVDTPITTVVPPEGTGNLSIPAISVSASGEQPHEGQSDIDLSVAVLDVQGEQTHIGSASFDVGPAKYYMDLTIQSGDDFASTPDADKFDITADIDLRVEVALDDWTDPDSFQSLVTKSTSSGDQRSWLFALDQSAGLVFQYSTDGTLGNRVEVISLDPSIADGERKWVRVTFDADDGADGNVTTFYKSDDGETWTQIRQVTNSGIVSIHSGTAPVRVGASSGSTNATGKFYKAEIYDGIEGTLVGNFDPTERDGETSWVASTGETWTLEGQATVVREQQAVVELDASGSHTEGGTEGGGALSFQNAALSAEGVQASDGVGTVELADALLSAQGVQTFEGVSDIIVQASVLDAAGALQPEATADIGLNESILTADGSTGEATGSASLALSGATLTAEGREHPKGVATLTLNAASLTASGIETIPGSAVLLLADSELVGTALMQPEGGAVLILSDALLVAEGVHGAPEGTGNILIDQMLLEAQGEQPHEGAGNLVIERAVLEGEGVMLPDGTAAIELERIVLTAQGNEGSDVVFSVYHPFIRRRRRMS